MVSRQTKPNKRGKATCAPLAERFGKRALQRRMKLRQRLEKGSVTPFLAMAIILMLGTVGIAFDLTRAFEAARQLQYAAQAAALYGLSLATNTDGSYSLQNAQSNIQNAIAAATFNSAQIGPQNNIWSSSVNFSGANIQFVQNPLDSNEFFLELTASRQGTDALQQFFIPLLYTGLNTALPNGVTTASPKEIVEVLGQPASRIGGAAPLTSQSGTRAGDLVGFAALPLAISNQQFAAIANSSQTGTTYTIDLVSSSSSEYTGAAPSGHLKGCLVNIYNSGSGYGAAQGSQPVSQLLSLIQYFTGANTGTITPSVVERGSQLSAFDPADSTFSQQQSTIVQGLTALTLLSNHFFIIPVLVNDPSFGNTNVVAGFARFSLTQVSQDSSGNISVTVSIGESVPVRNASCASGYSCVPGNTNSQLPAPVFPFTPRNLDSSSNGVSVRPRGVVLAPALSPRQVSPS